jgi:hypothetical protein
MSPLRDKLIIQNSHSTGAISATLWQKEEKNVHTQQESLGYSCPFRRFAFECPHGGGTER